MAALPFAAALASAGLMYLLAWRLFGSVVYAIVTVGIFVFTPLLWHQSQGAPASLYPLPFVVGWLLAVALFQDTRTRSSAIAAAIILGLGIYTSTAAVVMMPVYLVLTIAVLAYSRAASLPQLALLAGGVAVLALPLVLGLVLHPEVFRLTIKAYRLYDADRFNLLQGAREMASWVGLTARSEVYWDYFNPAFLFLTGRVLLPPLLALIPPGLYRAAKKETTPLARIVLLGFLASPFAASLTAESPTPGRILFITPFAAILSTYGIIEVAAGVPKFLGSWVPKLRGS